MIPYDDLVVALATWRARQGLPSAGQLSAAVAPPAAAPTPAAKVGSGPRTAAPAPAAKSAPGSGRTAAPAPGSGRTVAPVALPPEDSLLDVVDEADEHLEPEDEFANALDSLQMPDGEATAIGTAPARDSFGGRNAEQTLDTPTVEVPQTKGAGRGRNRNDDW